MILRYIRKKSGAGRIHKEREKELSASVQSVQAVPNDLPWAGS